MFVGLVMVVFYVVYGFVVDKLGLFGVRLMFVIVLLVFGVGFKVGEVLGFLGEYLKLYYLEESGEDRKSVV